MRILITRTDRIGDVMLSTPVIKAVRQKYPDAYISFCAQPHAVDILDNNPYLNEVIVYDKKGKHKNLSGILSFIFGIKKKTPVPKVSPLFNEGLISKNNL